MNKGTRLLLTALLAFVVKPAATAASAFHKVKSTIGPYLPDAEGDPAAAGTRAQLGIFGMLITGIIALVIVSIVALFGMDIAGEFADNIDVNNDYSDEANTTVNNTGNAFELFGSSTLVIPGVAVLAVLLGGLVGVALRGGGMGSVGGGRMGGR